MTTRQRTLNFAVGPLCEFHSRPEPRRLRSASSKEIQIYPRRWWAHQLRYRGIFIAQEGWLVPRGIGGPDEKRIASLVLTSRRFLKLNALRFLCDRSQVATALPCCWGTNAIVQLLVANVVSRTVDPARRGGVNRTQVGQSTAACPHSATLRQARHRRHPPLSALASAPARLLT